MLARNAGEAVNRMISRRQWQLAGGSGSWQEAVGRRQLSVFVRVFGFVLFRVLGFVLFRGSFLSALVVTSMKADPRNNTNPKTPTNNYQLPTASCLLPPAD